MAQRGLFRQDPATWPALARIDDLDAQPFTEAGLSPVLKAAYDRLIGPGRWKSRSIAQLCRERLRILTR
jgi:hypothetical protein